MGKRYQQKRSQSRLTYGREPLNPQTARGVFVVGLFAIGFISALSMFDLAGGLGKFVEKTLIVFFGKGKFLFPMIFFLFAYLELNYDRYLRKFFTTLGLFLFIISLLGILHLVVPSDFAKSVIGEDRGGGYLGYIISFPLRQIMGFWASLVLLSSIILASLLIIFETSISAVIERSRRMSQMVVFLVRIPYSLAIAFRNMLQRIQTSPKSEEENNGDFTDPEEEENFESIDFEANEIRDRLNPSPSENLSQQQLIAVEEKKKVAEAPWIIDLPIDLLDEKRTKAAPGDIKNNQIIIQKTLENFGVEIEMGEVNVGPTVTQYTLRPAEGIKLSKITTLHNDLALALSAHPIRIEAPIPGKPLVGIEVPNKIVAIVSLKEILSDEKFKNRRSSLMIALGKDVSGDAWLADLESMPHLLIAGATGSGKTVCINAIIVSLLYQNTPATLKFILVDPKRVELPLYNETPYLLTPVITDTAKTINALKWAIIEMERRFELLSKMGKRNIQTYNKVVKEKLPYIVVIIDELADLMAASARDVEGAIIRLAQMARAVGIHLILATQRPSVDVITGLIKANITSRIAFSVASLVDSRTILDMSGAEKLLGRGDMLYMSSELSKPKRLQGALVGDQEIQRIVEHLKMQGLSEYNEEIIQRQINGNNSSNVFGGDEFLEESDELLSDAKEILLQAGRGSASLLQRRLRIGYARAARILDLLEEEGFIGPADGARPREVLGKRVGVEEEKLEAEEKEEYS